MENQRRVDERLPLYCELPNLWIVSDTHFGFLDYKGKRVVSLLFLKKVNKGFEDFAKS